MNKIKLNVQFYSFYNKCSIVQCCVGQLQENEKNTKYEFIQHYVSQIPWRHNVLIVSKSNSINEAIFYIENAIDSDYNLREIINRIDELRFRTYAEKHEMSFLYEDKIKNMGNAVRTGIE